MTPQENLSRIKKEISQYMPCERFLEVHERLQQLGEEENQKLKALAELQQVYVDANSDIERESVKITVGRIRELSKAARSETRALKQELLTYMPLQKARELLEELIAAREASQSEIAPQTTQDS